MVEVYFEFCKFGKVIGSGSDDVTNSRPCVAVLLAAYNGSKFVETQVETILDQSDVDIYLYISVDYSDDNTIEIVQSIRDTRPNVFILPYGSSYGSAAKNFYNLVLNSKINKACNFVALADQDDIWFDWKLSRAAKILSCTSYDAVSSDVLAFWESNKTRYSRKSFSEQKNDYFFEAGGPGCTYVFTRDAFLFIRAELGKNTDLQEFGFHDWLFYALLRHAGYRWGFDKCATMLYRQHSENSVGVNMTLKSFLVRFEKIKSGWYSDQIKFMFKYFGAPSEFDSTNIWYILKNFRSFRRRPRDAYFLLFLILTRMVKI